MDDDAQPAALQRVLLKLSGEALAGDAEIDAVDIMLLHNQHEAAALEAARAAILSALPPSMQPADA